MRISHAGEDGLQRLVPPKGLGEVALTELGPLRLVVSEPLPELGGRNILEPEADGRVPLRQATGSDPVRENAESIVPTRLFVDSCGANRHDERAAPPR